jgi:PIN domain nuclease of toxin-antitoxin system
MKLLLDTHTFLWFIAGDVRLSNKARTLIEDMDNVRLLSTASLWEIAIKTSIGKLDLGLPFGTLIPQQLDRNLIDLLDITVDHAALVATLPFHHKDPFDRMVIAQALAEELPMVSVDPILDTYGITRLW